MFTNPVYNIPSKFNENLLAQNLADISLNNNSSSLINQQQGQNINFQFPQQQIDIGGYVPPSLNESNITWPSPADVNTSYQHGSTIVRQYNNSMIDDYYKKFLRPITDYLPIPTNGQPTYVYQNLGGTPGAATTTVGIPQQFATTAATSAEIAEDTIVPLKGGGNDETTHKKKHKKRSSKRDDGEKTTSDNSNSGEADGDAQQQIIGGPAVLAKSGAVGPRVPMRLASNPIVYFDFDIDNEPRGRLVMELFRHVLPRTTQNFLSLALNEHGFGYRLSYFHRIIPGFMAQAGDFEKSNGTGGYSIYGEKFDDEGFPYSHDRAGLLSMANSGPNTNGSQFFITFDECPHLDNKHVVFGQVLQGFHILKDLDMSGSDSGEVLREVKIAASGQLQ